MKIFMVGGAVRDVLMGVKPQDVDYVVVGATENQMFLDGFSKVGADFPVFLHPVTGDEYALARRERKTGTGYGGFETYFGTDVTLEDDAARRDLTINSIAMEEEIDNPGSYIVHDYFNGQDDIHQKILRHTSEAFAEDPVRVLRVARFRARFGSEWKVADETREMIYQMGKKGVLSELEGHRIWKELSRAMMEKHPRLFFDTLLECDVLHKIFPEIYRLVSAAESLRWHPEKNAYEHTMLVLTQSALFDLPIEMRMAALTHDFGKGLTPLDKLPSHFGHDVNGVKVVDNFCMKNKVPNKIKNLAMACTEFHMNMHKLKEITGKTYVKMFHQLNTSHSVEVLYWLGVCDERGRLGHENADYSDKDILRRKFDVFTKVKFADVFPEGETNPEKIKQGMHRARVHAVNQVS